MTLSLHLAPAAAILAGLHAQSFDEAWSEADFEVLLASPGVFALMARAREEPIGFILARIAGDEAEILTLAVNPARRRHGAGRKLVVGAADKALRQGATALFLEVAADNAPALALYEACGFRQVGRRDGYYARAAGAADALTLRRDLNSSSPGDYVSGRSD
jgi:ribosomal-protein-alanine N-acetyltransferase